MSYGRALCTGRCRLHERKVIYGKLRRTAEEDGNKLIKMKESC